MTSTRGEIPFKIGNVVRHQTFGVGVITTLEPELEFVTVDFGRGTMKRLRLELAQKVLLTLSDDGITALGVRDSSLVTAWTRDAPLKMVMAALIEKGGRATPNEIAPLITPYLQGLSWDAWWRRTRILLEKSDVFEIRPDGNIQASAASRSEDLISPALPPGERRPDPEPLSPEATTSLSEQLLRGELDTRDLRPIHLDQVLHDLVSIDPSRWIGNPAISLRLVDDIRAFRRLMAFSGPDDRGITVRSMLIEAVALRLRSDVRDRREKEKWLFPRVGLLRAYLEGSLRSLSSTTDQGVVVPLVQKLGELWIVASQEIGAGPSMTNLRDSFHLVCRSWSNARISLVAFAVEESPIYGEILHLIVNVLSGLPRDDKAALLWDLAARQPRAALVVLTSIQANAAVDVISIISDAIDRGLEERLATDRPTFALLAEGLQRLGAEAMSPTETVEAVTASFKAALASRNTTDAWLVWSERQLIAWTASAQRSSSPGETRNSEYNERLLQPILQALSAAANSNKATVHRLRSDYEKRIRVLESENEIERAKSSGATTVAEELSGHIRRIERTQNFEGILAAIGEFTSSMREVQLERIHLSAEAAWILFEARFRTSLAKFGATTFLAIGEECDYDLAAHEVIPGIPIATGAKVKVILSGVKLAAPDGGQIVVRKPLVEPLHDVNMRESRDP